MKENSNLYKEVGRKIRAYRGKNLSQEALGSAVGLTRASISNIENGRQKLLLHTFVDIADALQVKAGKLLPEKPSPTETVDMGVLANLRDNERAFIESAIGVKQSKGN